MKRTMCEGQINLYNLTLYKKLEMCPQYTDAPAVGYLLNKTAKFYRVQIP